MNKLKAKIIHRLGGVTLPEAEGLATKCVGIAKNDMIEFMNDQYGLPADEWCKKVYDAVTSMDFGLKIIRREKGFK